MSAHENPNLHGTWHWWRWRIWDEGEGVSLGVYDSPQQNKEWLELHYAQLPPKSTASKVTPDRVLHDIEKGRQMS